MTKTWISIVIIMLLGFMLLWAVDAKEQAKPLKINGYTISGPYGHKNLSIYLVHGEDKLLGKNIITLEEALKQKKIQVQETGSVGQLVLNNISGDVNIYIQSGDIVRGGKQDRTIKHDCILDIHSRKLSINSYCVESGRWQQRGKESTGYFSSSSNQIASRRQKLAVKYYGNQSEVWNEVANTQDKLSHNVGKSVRAAPSASSLELTLENKEVKKNTQEYTSALSNIMQKKKKIVGFVFAINGKINSADIYGSRDLFRQLWPKLLKAAATEALAEWQKDKYFTAPTDQEIARFFKKAREGAKKKQTDAHGTTIITRDGKTAVSFETFMKDAKDAVHINYINREGLKPFSATPRNSSRQFNIQQQQIQERSNQR
jgi:ARG/rhodanese/phosphatase superfamily protein